MTGVEHAATDLNPGLGRLRMLRSAVLGDARGDHWSGLIANQSDWHGDDQICGRTPPHVAHPTPELGELQESLGGQYLRGQLVILESLRPCIELGRACRVHVRGGKRRAML